MYFYHVHTIIKNYFFSLPVFSLLFVVFPLRFWRISRNFFYLFILNNCWYVYLFGELWLFGFSPFCVHCLFSCNFLNLFDCIWYIVILVIFVLALLRLQFILLCKILLFESNFGRDAFLNDSINVKSNKNSFFFSEGCIWKLASHDSSGSL